jgi:hypothetical protein
MPILNCWICIEAALATWIGWPAGFAGSLDVLSSRRCLLANLAASQAILAVWPAMLAGFVLYAGWLCKLCCLYWLCWLDTMAVYDDSACVLCWLCWQAAYITYAGWLPWLSWLAKSAGSICWLSGWLCYVCRLVNLAVFDGRICWLGWESCLAV